MKKILWLIPVIIIFSFLGVQGYGLYDIASDSSLQGIKVSWPVLRIILEPIAGLSQYMLSFTRYIVQIISWMLWIFSFIIIYGILKKNKLGKIVKEIAAAATIILTIVIIFLFIPLPAPYLEVPDNFSVVDFHSHTFFSHDGIASPVQSLFYHRNLGFTNFFDTEHGHTDGFGKFPQNMQFKTVFPGMQVSTKERVSLLILADKKFNGAEYRDKTVKEVIDLAHKNNFMVICPHWWKWRYFSWDDLYHLGIDGFEVSNAGYRNFSDEERMLLIKFCKQKKLSMIGTTDWHGWGYSTDVWTVLKPSSEGLLKRLKTHESIMLLIYRQPQVISSIRYFFEPFFGVYYYFGSLNWMQVSSWIIWIISLYFCMYLKFFKRLVLNLPIIFSIVFAAATAYWIIIWIPLLPENQILGKLIAPIFAIISIGWFYFWIIKIVSKKKM